jgi:hypothetical protein
VFLIACIGGAIIDAHPLFWTAFAAGAMVIASCIRSGSGDPLQAWAPALLSNPTRLFLAAWILIFFSASLVLFFAGSARYLLPMAAPVILLVSRHLSRPWLITAAIANLTLSLCLAWVNWQHWDGYRQFVRSIPEAFTRTTSRTWINGEIGLRFYAESEGAVPIARQQALQAGEWVLSSDLAFPIPLTAPMSPIREQEIRPTLGLRLVGLDAKSGYSSASFGLRPFDISRGPVDRIRAHLVRQRNATLSWLPMNAPEANEHILSGIYQLEGTNRWMSGRAAVILKPRPEPKQLEIELYLPEIAPARTMRVFVDGSEVHSETLPAPGLHTIKTKPVSGAAVSIELDKTFRVPGDYRDLGAVLVALGYR